MADIPYADWFRFIIPHFAQAGNKRLVELFSGPGVISDIAEQHGFEVVRLDRSLPALGKKGRRIAAEATALPLRRDFFAGLLAVNGSINYLPDETALRAHFAECMAILCRGGGYVFDFCPKERAYGLHARTFRAMGGAVAFSHRFSEADQQLLSTVVVRDNEGNTMTELHHQHIFTLPQIRRAAVAAGFEVRKESENYGLPFEGDSAPMVTIVLVKPALTDAHKP